MADRRDVLGDRKIVRVVVTGRVQGVGYRAWTVDTAERLGLVGWVRNNRDGSVEAVFSGSSAVVASMLAALHDGPPAARVDRVVQTDSNEPQDSTVFRVLPTA